MQGHLVGRVLRALPPGYCQYYASTMADLPARAGHPGADRRGLPARQARRRPARSRSATVRATSGSRSTSRATAGCRSIRPAASVAQTARPAVGSAGHGHRRGRCRASPCRRGSATTSSAIRTTVTGGATVDVEQPRRRRSSPWPSCSLVIVGGAGVHRLAARAAVRHDRRPRLPDGDPARRRGSGSARGPPRPSTSTRDASGRCCRSSGPSWRSSPGEGRDRLWPGHARRRPAAGPRPPSAGCG